MSKNGKNNGQAAGDDLLMQVLGLKTNNPKTRLLQDEKEQDKMAAALARLAEQNPELVAEIIQKWLTEEKDNPGQYQF